MVYFIINIDKVLTANILKYFTLFGISLFVMLVNNNEPNVK